MLNNHAWVKGKDKSMDANVTKYKKFIGIKEMTSYQILVLY